MNGKSTRFYSSRQEKTIAKNLQGKTTPNSGATPFIKGDVGTEQFLIEAKTCTKEQQSFSIKKEWLDKLKEEAFAMGKPYYALAFTFDGSARKLNNYYIINEATFKVLIAMLED